MIDVAIDIVKKHLDEYHSDTGFNTFTSANGKGMLFYNANNWHARIALELVDDDELTFYIGNQIRKKRILEGQLKLIGGINYSDRWDCYGFKKVSLN